MQLVKQITYDVDKNTIKEIAPQEYKIISQPHKSGKQGSGLALVYKESISVKKTSDDKTDFETIKISTFDIKFTGTVINLHLIYRLPSTSVLQFCSDMTDIMERRITDDLGKLLLIGNFNVHTDEPTEPDTTFLDFLDSFNLTSHVQWPMHRSGHTLDLCISDQDDTSIKSVTKGYMLSDHTCIDSTIEVQHNKPTTRLIKYRKLKDINKDLFFDNILENLSSLLVPSEQTILPDMVDTYNNGIQAAINKHASEKTKKVKTSHQQP